MAGIGFVLRKLAKDDDLLGLVKSFAHSAVASAGPWLFTVAALGTMVLIVGPSLTRIDLNNFRLIIIYNFAFTLVFSSPVLMIQTRYLADALYSRDVSGAVGLLIGSMLFLFGTQLPIATCFYFFYADLPVMTSMMAIVNYMTIVSIWPVSVYLSALKDYNSVSYSFGGGLLLAALSAGFMSEFGADGVLAGFTLGLVFCSGILVARVLAEYPYQVKDIFAFVKYFRIHKFIVLTGAASGCAIWIDKWIMWFAPEASKAQNNLITYPDYDTACFLAYLTIVPSMSVFLFAVETDFFDQYLKFYKDIQRAANLAKLERSRIEIIKSIFRGARNIIMIQVSVSILAIGIAPFLFDALDLGFLQLSIFRFAVIGSMFQSFINCLTIVISYFNNIRAMCVVYVSYVILNGLFTFVFMQLGVSYYGFGYAIAGICVFIGAGLFVVWYLRDLMFHAFITSNESVD